MPRLRPSSARQARPVRLQFRRTLGFDLQRLSRAANGLPAVLCTRASKKWGNPARVGANMVDRKTGAIRPMTAADAVRWFKRHGRESGLDKAARAELAGKNLACTCAIDARWCHVDVLLAWANPGWRR